MNNSIKYTNTVVTLFLILLFALLLVACGSDNLTDADYLKKANDQLNKGDKKAAVIELKNALQKNPKNVEARFSLGEIYTALGDGASGEKEFRKAISLGKNKTEVIPGLVSSLLLQRKHQEILDELKDNPLLLDGKDARIQTLAAEAFLGTGKVNKANSLLKLAMDIDSGLRDVKVLDAKIDMASNQIKSANQKMQILTQEYSDDKYIWFLDAILALQQANYKKAETAFEKSIGLEEPNWVSREGIESRIGLIQTQLAQNKLEEADKNIKTLGALIKDHPSAKYLSGVLSYKKKDYETARAFLQEVVAVAPDHFPSILLLGAAHYALGSFEQASVNLSRYVSQVPTHLHARKLLAATRLKQQRPAEAYDMLQKVVDKNTSDTQLLAMIGKASVSSGNVKRGINYLKKAAKVDPGNPSIRTELAKVYMSEGAFDSAIGELQQFSEGHEKQRDILIVFTHLRNNDFAQAEKLANKLASNSDDPALQSLKANVYLLKGERDTARANYMKALEFKNDFIPALLSLARLDIEDGDLSKAEKYFDRVLLSDTKNMHAMMGLAQLSERRSEFKQALEWVEKARIENPKKLLPAFILVKHYLKTRKTEKAETILDSVNEEHFQQPAVLLLASQVKLASKKKNDAIQLLTKLTKKLPNKPGAYFELANAYASAKEFSSAERALKKALKVDAKYYQAKMALAKLKLREGKDKDAIRLSKEVQKEQGKLSLGYAFEGDIQFKNKKYTKAQALYTKALAKQANSLIVAKLSKSFSANKENKKAIDVLNKWLKDNAKDSGIASMLAQEYMNIGNSQKAINIMETMSGQMPDDVALLNNLAWMYHQENDPRAAATAEKALKLSPNNGVIKDTLGWIMLKNRSDVEKAVKLIKESAKQYPNQRQIQYHLAAGLYETGEKARAKDILNKIMNDGKLFDERDEAEKLLAKFK